MQFAKRLLMVAGAVAFAGLFGVMLAPRAVHAVVATLVQIVPGSTTHVGQNESQLVALLCHDGQSYCVREDPSGALSSSPFVVPAGYTLIITDYNWTITNGGCIASTDTCGDSLENSGSGDSYSSTEAFVPAAADGSASNKIHFSSGFRIASGVTIEDHAASVNFGQASLFGYLVPN